MLFCVAWGKLLGRRAGRKRKAGKRHPSGQLVRADKHPDDKVRASRQPHRRVLKAEDRLSEKAESPLGRLYLTGQLAMVPLVGERGSDDSALAAARYEAGILFAAAVGAYRAVIEAPRSIAGSGRGFDCAGCELTYKSTDCACLARRQRYTRAYEALAESGRRAIRAVIAVAIHREEIAREDLVNLVAGLSALARHFGLTRGRKQVHSGNAN